MTAYPRRRAPRTAIGLAIGLTAALSWGAVGTTAFAAPALPQQVQASFVGLEQGARGDEVASLQRALIASGITVAGGADGIFGPATRRALVSFQNARGLSATGVVDDATSSALSSSGSTGTATTTATTTTATSYAGLTVGSTGDLVREVQRTLIAFGVYLSSGADGTWTPATTRGVTQFQRWNGLTVTGTINTATERRLGLGTTASTPPAATATTTTTATATPASTSTNPYVGLAQGARGTLVVGLQKALQGTGLVVRGGADGAFGPATARALNTFLRVNGLTQNGIVSERAATILGLGTTSTSATTTPPADDTTTAAPSPYLGLAVGANGRLVVEVQRALLAAGVSVRGGADGAFGNATRSALVSYQTAAGIRADGVVDQATIDKLALGSSNSPVPFASTTPTTTTATPPSSDNPYVGLTTGSRGSLVSELQNALMNTGLTLRGGADGAFGHATASALKTFQSVNGIAATGVVTEQGAKILALGSGTVTPAAVANTTSVSIDRFPVQGQCFFGDTWHAARGNGRLHKGVDVIAAEGKLLYAVVDGEISKLYWDQPGALSGNGLRIAQPNGTYFTYLHMLGFAPGIELGTKVKAGDVIGWVGNTGSSSTAHLHFEVHPGGGAAINPYLLIKAIDGCSDSTPQYQSSFT